MHFGFDDFVHLLRTDLIWPWIWWHSLNELALQMAQPLYISDAVNSPNNSGPDCISGPAGPTEESPVEGPG